ncbi:MAG: peptide ABC transporter substrate-binding protein [Pararhodobacter sp.]|nr:peptide ABC transporter substrate-binding protein [Pararhodobacter sp.]
MKMKRRTLLQMSAASVAAGMTGTLALPRALRAQAIDDLVIAYNVNLPSWDPTTGPSAVNPTIQGLYQSVFDQYILQQPDLSPAPGLLTDWGWNEDRTQVWMEVREGVKWHDGSDFTAEDVRWSLERVSREETGSPMQFVWGTLANHRVEGNRVIADVAQFDPTIFKWMYFLTGYVLPKDYYERVGAAGFEEAPIGTGPYMVEQYERNAFVRLRANPDYWGGAPEFETVTIRFVTDSASRVAEIESGRSHVTLEVPYDEYDRLRARPGLAGSDLPISDIAMIFFSNRDAMTDPNVRKAAVHAVDKQLIIDRLLDGYGVALHTLETPEYLAFDPTIEVEYNPDLARELLAESGYSTDNPARFTIQTTRGYKPKDYEMIQAIVGMWRRVGIEAEIEVYEVARHFELRAAGELAPAAFYNWGNSVGDPTTSTGFAMFGPSPHSAWSSDDLDAMIGPLWGEADEDARIEGWKAVSRHIAENAYVLPILQYVQPVVHSERVNVTQHASGALLPHLMTRA